MFIQCLSWMTWKGPMNTFIDEAGFNLAKGRQRGRNIIGQCAILEVSGQRISSVNICAARSNWAFSIVMQTWSYTTLNISLHFWEVLRTLWLYVSSWIS